MCLNMRKCTFWHMRPMKTQNSLRICAVWLIFVVRMKKLCALGHPKCAPWRLWLDCANALAYLNLGWAHMSGGTFSNIILIWASYSKAFFHCVCKQQAQRSVYATMMCGLVFRCGPRRYFEVEYCTCVLNRIRICAWWPLFGCSLRI